MTYKLNAIGGGNAYYDLTFKDVVIATVAIPYDQKDEFEQSFNIRETIFVVFDGPPSPDGGGRFVEVETADGKSINAGSWLERSDGLYALRMNFSENREELNEVYEAIGLATTIKPTMEIRKDAMSMMKEIVDYVDNLKKDLESYNPNQFKTQQIGLTDNQKAEVIQQFDGFELTGEMQEFQAQSRAGRDQNIEIIEPNDAMILQQLEGKTPFSEPPAELEQLAITPEEWEEAHKRLESHIEGYENNDQDDASTMMLHALYVLRREYNSGERGEALFERMRGVK